MAIRDLLVLAGDGMDAAGAYGIWLAKRCGAALTAAAPVIEASAPGYVDTELPRDLLERIEAESKAAAARALEQFAAKAQGAGVKAETLAFMVPSTRRGAAVSELARCYDAAVVPQPSRDGADTADILEETLFAAGRPIIIVPYIPVRQELGTVLVAWDGGRPAARAVADALPILAMARGVQVVTVGKAKPEASPLSAQNLIRHLARHGIAAELKWLASDGVDVANLLLSHAADADADLIVMGGYGHSRMRELVLGGTTREILRSMTIPVLMSH